MSQTFTAEEIKHRVLTYDEGCTAGKITFLKEAFDIDANCEQRVAVLVIIKLPAYAENDGWEEIDHQMVAAAVEHVVDRNLADELNCADKIDCRVNRSGMADESWTDPRDDR